MNTEQFTATVRKSFGTAQTIALRRHHQRITDLHLLAGLIEDDGQAANRLLMRSGASMDTITDGLETALEKLVRTPLRICSTPIKRATLMAMEKRVSSAVPFRFQRLFAMRLIMLPPNWKPC